MAHLAIFRREFTQQREWLSDAEFSELVALCQFIPGPASSQVGMALGYRRGGLLGALAAFLGFTAPSALIMALAAAAWAHGMLPDTETALIALKCVAVAVVTDAALGMWRQLCQTPATRLTAVLSAVLLLALAHPLAQLGLIAIAVGVGITQYRAATHGEAERAPNPQIGAILQHGIVWVSIALLLGLSILLLSTLWATPISSLMWSMYQAGGLVFGGGHVVLPLLEASVVPPIDSDTFLAGYGLAQAMPGPLFTVASFLGAVFPGVGPIEGALLATGMIFLPGGLLLAAAMPAMQHYLALWRPHLIWVNAVVVGLLFAVLMNPVIQSAVVDSRSAFLAGVGLVMTLGLKQSPLRVVIGLLSLAYLMRGLADWI